MQTYGPGFESRCPLATSFFGITAEWPKITQIVAILSSDGVYNVICIWGYSGNSLSLSTYSRENVNIWGITIKNLNLCQIMGKRQSILPSTKSIGANGLWRRKKLSSEPHITIPRPILKWNSWCILLICIRFYVYFPSCNIQEKRAMLSRLQIYNYPVCFLKMNVSCNNHFGIKFIPGFYSTIWEACIFLFTCI